MDRPSATGIRAVLFTDMVGSTQLRGALGEDRADALRRDHDELLGPIVSAHDGTVLRWTGDGMKAQFGWASAAVSAAIDMQRAVARYSRSAAAVAAFRIRIGISVGEVTEDDGDIHGVPVIEAARLEPLAEPGEILATQLVAQVGRRRVEAGFEDVGSRMLKGLSEAVEVVRVIDLTADGSARPMPMAISIDRRFPLVGRAASLASIDERWSQACAGETTTVLVAGQAGIGKSRLIAHAVETAHTEGALVLAGICESDLSRPYQPFAMAFGDAHVLDEELTAAVGTGSGPLGPLFPNRRSARADDAGAAARYELFDSVIDLIDRLAADQPVILVLEDLHWASSSTVQLLRHIVRESSRCRLLILGSYRQDDIGAAHPMHEVFADLRGSSRASRIELSELDATEVAELLRARAPDAPDINVHRFASRVREESGGNAFFVCELLHHLLATGDIERMIGEAEVDRLPIPDSVRDVVGQRLSRLAPEASNVLAWAAVIGLSFDLELLAGLMDQRSEAVLEVLEDVARVALVQEVAAGRFSFAHAIVRATLLESLTATRRALSHRRVAERIEILRPSDHDELAHHWEMAGDSERANDRLERAARRDLEALAYESAADRYQALVDYHHRQGSSNLELLARAWLGLGLARRAMGMPEYLPAVMEAGRIAQRLRNADLVADAALASIWPGTFFITAGTTEVALVELGEHALRSISADDPRRARLLATMAAHLTFDADRERRVALIAEAHEHARRDGDAGLIGMVLVAEHLSLWDPFTFERRGEIAALVADAARKSGDVELAFFAGFFAAIAAVERCDIALARRCLADLDGAVRAAHNFYFGFLTERLSASLDILTRRDGVQNTIDAIAEKYAGTHADTLGSWSLQTGGLAWQRGDLADLVETVREIATGSSIEPNWTAAYAFTLMEVGDRDGAREILDRYVEPTIDYFWLTTLQTYAEVAVTLDHHELIDRLLPALLPHRDQLGITASGSLCFGLVGTTVGMLALATGADALAVDVLESAKRRADSMSAPFESVRARRLLAEAYGRTGRATQAATMHTEAAALIDEHGFEGERRRLASSV